jgi:hypothetical protein
VDDVAGVARVAPVARIPDSVVQGFRVHACSFHLIGHCRYLAQYVCQLSE